MSPLAAIVVVGVVGVRRFPSAIEPLRKSMRYGRGKLYCSELIGLRTLCLMGNRLWLSLLSIVHSLLLAGLKRAAVALRFGRLRS